jgi:NitT/TauT family transport system substrate-binding protein
MRPKRRLSGVDKKMKRFSVLVVAALWLVCAACGKKQDAIREKINPVTLQLNWKAEPQFGGFYAADVAGRYRSHGLDVKITQGGAGAPTIDMLGAGTVPFAIVAGDEIVRARANGNPIVALFAVYQTNPQGIMTRAARGFKTLADVFTHGGTLAIERGLPYSDFLQKKYGFGKLKIVPSPFGDLTLYRTQKDYAMQCFVTSEPIAAKKIGIEPQTFLIADSGYNPYTTVLATSERYLSANRAIVQAMVDAAREGWQAYLNDPAKTNEYMGKLNPTMDAETFAASAAAQKPLLEHREGGDAEIGGMTAARWQELTAQLVDLKVIDKSIDANAILADLGRE